jgi:hypothetical protein
MNTVSFQAQEVHASCFQALLVHMQRPASGTVQVEGGRPRRSPVRAPRQSERMRGDARRQHFPGQIRHQAGSAQRRRHVGNVDQM